VSRASADASLPQHHRAVPILGCIVALAALAAYLAYFSVRIGLNAPTRAAGDEPDYDSIAWELSRGNGFRVDYLNPDFRRPYEEAAPSNDLYRLLSRQQGLKTYRPPLFPCAVAAGNVLFGRQFWAMRIWNAAAMAACCGLAVAAAGRCFGTAPAVMLALLFVGLDTRTRLYAQAFLTESFAACEVALLFLLMAHGLRGRIRQTCLAGLLTGAMILTRTMFLLWVPWLTMLVVILVRRNSGTAWTRALLVHGGTFAIALGVTLLPWGVRNCLILGRPMPLGTQGAIELPAAWGDLAWELGGEWRSGHPVDFAEPDPDSDRSLPERELAAADAGVTRAKEWIARNPGKALALVPMKIVREFTPKTWSQAILLALAVIGALFGRRCATDVARFDLYLKIGLTFIAAQMLAVGLTWTVPESRFVVPLLFVEHFLAAAGVVVLIRGVVATGSSCSRDRAGGNRPRMRG
jgi:hypothetical protein